MFVDIKDPLKKKDKIDTIPIGIDLGTTHSLVSYIGEEQKVSFIKWDNNHTLLPSIVTYGKDKVFVGYEAYKNPQKSGILASTKRFMQDPNQYLYEKKTPIDIAADILTYIKEKTETQLQKKIAHCVITVPAYFDDTARNATKIAAQIAGLEVRRIINEPTAAALAYGLEEQKNGTYAVYDLGGGTFDLSVLRMSQGVFQVLSTTGSLDLGGDDIDSLIVRHWLANSPETDIKKLKSVAKEAKEYLTDHECWQSENLILTQKELLTIASPFIEETLMLCKKGIKDAELDTPLDGIIFVGGSTKLYKLKETVKNFFNVPCFDHLDPDCTVAQGAAIQSHALLYGMNHVLIDVNPLSIGLETMGGLVEKVIPRNTPIPITKTQQFTTFQDGQTAIHFHIVQGERELAKDCLSLAEFTLSNIPPERSGSARIEVTFHIDTDGLLTIKALEQKTQQILEVQVKPTFGLDEKVVQKMVLEAQLKSKDDIKNRLYIGKKIEAEQLIEKAKECIYDSISGLSNESIEKIKKTITALNQGIQHANLNLIETLTDQLAGQIEIAIQNRLSAALKKRVVGTKV